MKRFTILALVGLFVLAGPAIAEERNWDYTDLHKRDYDRGFFINLEGWFASPKGLPNEYAVADDNVAEIDQGYQISPRVQVGGVVNDRVGTFVLTWFNYNETDDDSVEGSEVYSTVYRPEIGLHTSAYAEERTKVTTVDFDWRKPFGQTRRFDAFWSAGLRYFKLEDDLSTTFSGGEAWSASNKSEAFGIKVGVGGTFWFVPRFGMRAGLYAAFLNGDTESGVTSNVDRQRYEKDNKTFTQLEGELMLIWRAVGGLNFWGGYRFADYMEAVDIPGGPGGEEDVRLDGPFVGIGVIFGVRKVDTDGDGVLNNADDCPGTVMGCTVDRFGCSSDFDEDGICDGLDRCPGTDFGARVDANGCAMDSDSDGVADGLDLCPDTPFGCHVDGKGCPRDTDGDGVCDGTMDLCPDTPRGARVDKRGCAIDSDGDTVPDNIDRCPNTPKGMEVNEYGCEMELVFQNIEFEFDRANILSKYHSILDKVVKAMRDEMGMEMTLHGHTDWIGTEEYNLKLSMDRAVSVKDYLVQKGVATKRLQAKGHGECCPVASNATEQGRAKNRRVEFERTR